MLSAKALTLLAAALLIAPLSAQAQPGPGPHPPFPHQPPAGPMMHGRMMGGPGRPGPGMPPGPGGWHGWRPGPQGWRRGDYFAGWRTRRYMVPNWRGYPSLYALPPGYYWTRYGNQFLLTAIATGVITEIVGASVPPAAPPPY